MKINRVWGVRRESEERWRSGREKETEREWEIVRSGKE